MVTMGNKARSVAVVLGLMLTFTVFALPVEVSLDRNNIGEGETVRLIFESRDSEQILEPDLTVLDTDFLVLDQSSETRVSIVNGRQTAIVRLLVNLEPRRAGQLRIPAIEIGGELTRPLILTVAPVQAPAPGEPEPVYLEVSFDPAEDAVYVHSQISLVVRLLYLGTLANARLGEPAPDNATIQRINENRFSADRHGQKYQGLERRYAIFPERSGMLLIPPVKFDGRVVQARRSIWDAKNRGRRISTGSDAIEFQVKPKPGSYPDQPWLPARLLQGQQSISEPAGGLHVGEPITRTISLEALGLSDNMLPRLSWPKLNQARVYPDAPESVTRVDGSGNWLVSRSTTRFAVVPNQPGQLELPALKIPWWDVVNDRLQEINIPARVVEVLPALSGQPQLADPQVADIAPALQPAGPRPFRERLWIGISGSLAILWLATLWLWYRRGLPDARTTINSHEATSDNQKQLLGKLRAACQSNKAATTLSYLKLWSGEAGLDATEPGVEGLLESLKEDHPLRPAILALDQFCYGQSAAELWDGNQFWQLFRDWHKTILKGRSGVGRAGLKLPELYPGQGG